MPRPSCKTCDPWTLASPSALLDQLARRSLLVPGADLGVVVRNEDDHVLGVSEVQLPTEEWASFSEEVDAALVRAGARRGPAGRPQQTAHLVRRRLGHTTSLSGEHLGWRVWSNACSVNGVFFGEWLLVTDHGWRTLVDPEGPVGVRPRLSGRSSRRLAVVAR